MEGNIYIYKVKIDNICNIIFSTNIGEFKNTHFNLSRSNVTCTNLHSTASREICKFVITNKKSNNMLIA